MLNLSVKTILSCVFCSVFLSASSAWGITFAFEDARPLYVGSRPLGMGNAFTAIADDAEAGFWNPAGLVQWQGVKIGGSQKVSDRKDYAFDPKCIAYSYRDTGFFWGNKIALRAESGTPDFTYYSLARKLTPYLAMGGSVKFRRKHPSDYYQFFGHSPGYDLGVLWKPNALSSTGILIQNMGDAKHWISVVTLGFAHRFSNRSLLSADIATLFGDDPELEAHVGWEWQTTDRIALRLGISDGDSTAGAGLSLLMFRVDYAWIRNDAGDAHFLSAQMEL
ncbi:hypothetical protein ACFL6S_11790 [Candidatus Poribacteria bacterium]